MKLTKSLLRDLHTKDKDLLVWDDGQPGFGIRVKANGTKTFMIQYRNQFGRMRRYSIGRLGDITLDQARKEARRLKSEIALGGDPAEKRQEDRSSITVRELSERYMSDHCEGRCKESTMKAHRWLLDKFILPKYSNHRVLELSTQDIATLHKNLKDTPYNANRVLGLLKSMFNKAEQWGLISPSTNPAATLKPYRENKRNRFLSPEEYNALFNTVEEQHRLGLIGTYQAGAISLLMLTGCRLSEILTLEWRMVDLVHNRLLLDRHKTDRKGVKAVPLNKLAQHILRNLPRVMDNPYVIVGKEAGRPLINLQKPWRRVRKAAGLDDVRLHDLRHSFASAAAAAGVPLQVIGGLLGHSSQQTTARYAHLSQAPIDQAAMVVGALLEQSREKEEGADV
ncbi:tyrosine-type recombinase/integrase [Terasakiella sp.]|uniref:tyrosine-type recombinase/integrase n=1 Tax=Terasakiella sp. TaxID=2034861 RepID=UPI003AA847FC